MRSLGVGLMQILLSPLVSFIYLACYVWLPIIGQIRSLKVWELINSKIVTRQCCQCTFGSIQIVCNKMSVQQLFFQLYDTVGWQEGHPACKQMGGWWSWALVSLDGVTPSQVVCVSAPVNLPLHHEIQKFSSGTSSPGWSRKKGHKRLWWWWLNDK